MYISKSKRTINYLCFKKLSAFLFLLLLVVSCKKENTANIETDNLFKFRDYISYTTAGRVSVYDPVIINLVNDVEGWETGQEIPDHIITIEPKVKGKVLVENAHSLIFKPTEPLQPDTEYKVTIKLSEIYKNQPKEFGAFTFEFKTITPNFSLTTNYLQSYSKAWQYLEATLKSADIIDINDAKQLVEAFQNGKKLNLQWNESIEKSRVFEFKIDSINRLVEDSEVLVKWNGKAIKANNVGENTVAISGINSFTIVKVDVVQAPEQYLSINFSDPIKKQQNFDGLIAIQNSKHPKFIVDGNVLKVYPDSKLVGDILVDVFQGISNTDGFKLKKPFSETISFEELKPQVRLISNGTILPNSEALKFNFEAVNLKAVDVRIIKILKIMFCSSFRIII